MTDLVFAITLGSIVLVIIGALIGQTIAEHLHDQQIRQQAAVRRRIGEQWRELQLARTRTRCPRCGEPCIRNDSAEPTP